MTGRHVAADHGTTRQARMIQTDETDDTFHHPADMDGHQLKLIEESPPRSRGRIGPPFIERGEGGGGFRHNVTLRRCDRGIYYARPS